jgi:hypothetical protein
MADPSTSLKLLVAAIKSRSPVSFHYDKAGKIPGLRIGNPHAAFIMQRKDGTESTKIDIRTERLMRSRWLKFDREADKYPSCPKSSKVIFISTVGAKKLAKSVRCGEPKLCKCFAPGRLNIRIGF